MAELAMRSDRRLLDPLRASVLARDVAVACCAAFVLGVVRLGAPSLWIDESATARATSESYLSFMTDQYHWLYYTLMKPWAVVVGTSEWALRFPSVVGTMLACGLLVVLANRLFDRWIGLLSGLLLATSPFVVKWSQQARGYTFLLALAVLATVLLLRALEKNTRGAWALYGLALAAAIVCHPVGGVLILPANAVLAYQRRDRVFPHGLLAAVIVCVLALPWVGQIGIRSSGERAAINWLDAPCASVAFRALTDVSGAAGLGLLLAAAGLAALGATQRWGYAAWLGTWAFAPFAVSLLVSVVKPIYLDRYLIVAAPAFAMLAAVAVMAVATRLRVALIVAVVVVSAVGLVRWYELGRDGNWHGENWRSAVRAVDERLSGPEDVVVAEWSAHDAAEYYGASVVDVSTAPSIWVLRWSERGRPLEASERRRLGFGDHVLVEELDFGSRLDAQHWVRNP
jgi:mannosyltransferase